MTERNAIHAERKNRTVICCVLFVDIVGFSEASVGDQTSMKEHFNHVIAEAVQHIPPVDRMMLDTGDGIALCLFGDPEEGMFLALSMRGGFVEARPSGVPNYRVRIGLNLGPIKIVTDVNGQLNAIGDGINVAQRVMTFAEPGQVLCARSYFEIVSRLSDDFTRLFEYCGARHDKHVREHDVYEVRSPSAVGSSSYAMPEVEMPTLAAVGCTLPEALRDSLTSLLAKYEGPLAKVLIRKACERESTPELVINRLAEGIGNQAESSAFRKAATELIAKLK